MVAGAQKSIAVIASLIATRGLLVLVTHFATLPTPLPALAARIDRFVAEDGKAHIQSCSSRSVVTLKSVTAA